MPVTDLAEHKQIARNLYDALGGNKFVMMTGAYNPVALNDQPGGGLQIDLKARNPKGINRLRVIVDYDTDTLIVEFWKITRHTWLDSKTPEPVYKTDGIDVGDLRELFTRVTGLQTSLGTLGR